MRDILYFEGCGMDINNSREPEPTEITNHRFRTCFLDNAGKGVYLEATCHYNIKAFGRMPEGWNLWVDSLHYIEGENPENLNRIKFEQRARPATYDTIKNFIKDHTGVEFDEIIILGDFEGYRVFGDYSDYNLMDNFTRNESLAIKTRAKVEELNNIFIEKLKKPFPCFSVLKYDDKKITVRHCDSDQALKASGLTRVETYFY